MRKIVVSMNVTIDGFMAGTNCELDWHFQNWTEEMAEFACRQLDRADTILLGRITYEAMAGYWPSQAINLLCPRADIAFADMMSRHAKIVFSKTLEEADPVVTCWHNSRVVKKNIKGEIIRLKRQPGKDIIVYGSGTIVSALTRLNLVDEYQVWVHPVFIGKGKRLFNNLPRMFQMKLFQTKTFGSGVIVLYYECR